MTERNIDFADYEPTEVPERFPKQIWAYWDFVGEFMEATEDPAKGAEWIASGSGYVRHYTCDAERDPR